MGIRFACHACAKPLNIKQELAGKRGICPACRCRFRIPLQDAATSRPVEASTGQLVTAGAANDSTGGESSMDAEPVTSRRSSISGAPRPRRPEREAQPAMEKQQAVDVSQSDDESPISSLDLLSSDPESTWYVRPPTGGQYGPASGEMLREWIDEGRVATTSLLWRDGWPQWREASEAFPELAQALPATGDSFGYGDSSFAADSPVSDEVVSAAPSVALSDASSDTSSDATPTKGSRAFSGSDRIGAARRAKSMRRTMVIVGLASVAVMLLVVLIVVATQS